MNIIKKFSNWLLNVILLVSILLCLLLYFPRLLGYNSYTILSGSMLPSYKIGSVVFSKSIDINDGSLKVGDVIIYSKGDKKVSHRVYSIDWDNKSVITKGDNNNSCDSTPVSFSDIDGKVSFNIPYIGYISILMRNKSLLKVIGILFSVIVILYSVSYILSKSNKVGDNVEKN